MKILYIVSLTFFSLQSFSQVLDPGDKAALKAIYNSMGGEKWYPYAGYLHTDIDALICASDGITCENGRVTALDLLDVNLGGSIPVEIGNLTALKSLSMGISEVDWALPYGMEQQISGNIPEQIGNLTALESLVLTGNDFSGSVPAGIWNLSKLKHVDLHYIPRDSGFDPFLNLSGSLPADIDKLTRLEYLDLSYLNMSGSIPASIGELGSLKHLDLSHNDFIGNLPAEIGNLTNLEFFSIQYFGHQRSSIYGKITGSVPASFGNLTSLKWFDISGQTLSGPLPDLTGIPVAAIVNVGNNQFTFAGISENVAVLDYYGGQRRFEFVIAQDISGSALIRSEVGGSLSNSTFKYYKENVLVSTITGDNKFYVNKSNEGNYRVEVTNTQVPGLTMISNTKFVEAPLPVTLVHFSGLSSDTQNHLTWQTTSETNNAGFEIERSADARTFEKFGYLDGNGDSKEANNYRYTDTNPFATTYYRLKQLDHDGKFEYSSIISLKNSSRGISVYPNPATSLVTVSGELAGDSVVIYDVKGIAAARKRLSAEKSFDVSGLAPGTYTIRIGNVPKKLVIQK